MKRRLEELEKEVAQLKGLEPPEKKQKRSPEAEYPEPPAPLP